MALTDAGGLAEAQGGGKPLPAPLPVPARWSPPPPAMRPQCRRRRP